MAFLSLLALNTVCGKKFSYVFIRREFPPNNCGLTYAFNAVFYIAYIAVPDAKAFYGLLDHVVTVRWRKLICIEFEVIPDRRYNDHKVNESALQRGIYHCYVTVMNGIERASVDAYSHLLTECPSYIVAEVHILEGDLRDAFVSAVDRLIKGISLIVYAENTSA